MKIIQTLKITTIVLLPLFYAEPVMAASASLGEVTVPTESGRTLSMRLWVPDNTAGARVRGILVATHPSGTEGASYQQDYRPLAQNPTDAQWVESTSSEWNAPQRMDLAMQLVAKRHNFALVGMYFSGQNPAGYSTNGTTQTIMQAQSAALEAGLVKLGTNYKHPEFSIVPIATYGFSGGAGFSIYYAAYNPGRCIAVAYEKGVSIGYYDPVYLERGEQVPAMLTYGELETDTNITTVKNAFSYHRAKGALWFIIPDYNMAHAAQGYGRFLGAAFVDRVIEKRIPRNWVPSSGTAPVLQSLVESDGWLGDNTTEESSLASIVSFADSGATLADKRTMSWLPDQTMAEAWRAVVTHLRAGNISSPLSTLTATNPKQLAFFNLNVNSQVSQLLRLTAPGGNVTAVDWMDGDLLKGTVSASPFSLTLSYLSPGIHLVRGNLQLSDGGSSTSELALLLVNPSNVNQVPVIQTGPTVSDSTVIAGVPTTCSAKATDPDGSIEELLTYTWSTTDGPGAVTFGQGNGTNAGKIVTASFPLVGTYNLQVAVKDSIGNSNPTIATKSVIVTSPLYNDWVSLHQLSGADALDSATPAGDGITNLMKYALGLDPRQVCDTHTDGVTPGLPLFTSQGSSLFLLFQRDTSKTDITYTVETSVDLSVWNPNEAMETIQSTLGSIQTIKATVAIGSESWKFAHLKIKRE